MTNIICQFSVIFIKDLILSADSPALLDYCLQFLYYMRSCKSLNWSCSQPVCHVISVVLNWSSNYTPIILYPISTLSISCLVVIEYISGSHIIIHKVAKLLRPRNAYSYKFLTCVGGQVFVGCHITTKVKYPFKLFLNLTNTSSQCNIRFRIFIP